jgi:O-antigen ligase
MIMTRLFPQYSGLVGRAVFWGLLGGAIVAWATDNILKGRPFIPFENIPVKATALIFLFWGAVTLYGSQDVFLSIRKLSHVAIGLVALYMFYDFFSRDDKNIRKLLKVVLLVTLGVSFATIASSMWNFISGLPVYKRIAIWYWNPNALGYFLFMCIPISISVGLHWMQSRALKVFLVTTMLIALVFSFHRTSWVAGLVAVFFLLPRSRMKMPFWAVIVAAIFLSGLFVPVVGDDVYSYVTGDRYTGRKEIWKAAWTVASEYPLLGTGAGTSVHNISQHIETSYLQGQDTHSVYLKNAVELGIMSVVIVVVFYVLFFYYTIRIERSLQSNFLKAVTRGSIATLLGLSIHGIL